ncbi:hypothetical protein GMOD_00007125 [Pyrenophora seminiperda CCB06]|uniref:Aminoacyl-transfer RNA synthetases class-II family profile domain-containing protein n=1 Tax=Pyrenophora seminiperda CCB06 TaxID=1302712 RepID=A0A3M7MCF3_9PLEO|nr:hypothetical protein GMOD_00007125 [Pyrenophora seminiperda CCB06]
MRGRRSCLHNSYLEISRYSRTGHHGIAHRHAALCPRSSNRFFNISNPKWGAITPEESLRKTLDDFKATIQPSGWKDPDIAWGNSLHEIPNGQEIQVFGYLSTRRDVSGKLSFTILRHKDGAKCIQLVSTSNNDTEKEQMEAHARIRSLKEWTPVMVKGKLMDRKPLKDGTTHLDMKLETRKEIAIVHIEPLNEISNDIIIKNDTVFGPHQRHLQLRTDSELRSNIILRSETMTEARLHLNRESWREIETPILFKSTPEGAREFLVPTRQKGLAYALPQSPQQYKQILMASGFTKYYQFARCFRDEDLRVDRQPEFTQLDMEMSFAGEEEVMAETEQLLRAIWRVDMGESFPEKIPRVTYQEAMASYGSDKPDLRFETKIHNITQHLTSDLIGKITPLQEPVIDAMKISISEDPKVTRKFVAKFLDGPDGKPYLDNPDGQPGIFIGDLSQPMQGLGPLGYQYVMEGPEALAIDNGDVLILQARPNAPFSGGSTTLGNLRLALHKAAIAQGLMDTPSQRYEFVWITDFPLFTPSSDSEPGQGGEAGFSHLLDVLRSGCPPHAGIALGWDRLMAVLCNRESVRDVIAFPKSGKGEDLLVKSPNRITEEQLGTYHLQVKKE